MPREIEAIWNTVLLTDVLHVANVRTIQRKWLHFDIRVQVFAVFGHVVSILSRRVSDGLIIGTVRSI